MRIIFMGTPSFAIPTLDKLIKSNYEICCVYTQPPKPSGRGLRNNLSPIHKYANDLDLMVKTPVNFSDDNCIKLFKDFLPSVCVVVAYGVILPSEYLNIPKFGCLNLHASLLPRWRGAAPIQRAILSGDKVTGVTTMRMEKGLDSGDIYLKKEVKIERNVNAGKLHDILSIVGADLVLKTLEKMSDRTLIRLPQNNKKATYAKKINKKETFVNWAKESREIERQVRAFSPFPGTWSLIQNKRIKILSGEVVNTKGEPGEVIGPDLVVGCGRGAYKIKTLQLEGKKPMKTEDFLRGNILEKGIRIG